MEVQNISNKISSTKEGDGDDIPLPGFRFHPTDEKLVGFYLKRKVEKLPIKFELIKQADIYKYDPWDLPKSSTLGDNNNKEWYLFCKRGRKYRNSIRPNRVTISGFWKATGIDKPIYSSSSKCIIGLKKSLVYYRGFAGKGTKTDWMMHEFRLPPTQNVDAKTVAQEAEVWTICRILKRNINSYNKCTPDNLREVSTNNTIINPFSSKINHQMSYNISFNSQQIIKQNDEEKPYFPHNSINQQYSSSSSFSSSICCDMNQFLRHADWEDLCSIVDSSAGFTTTAANPLYF